MYWYAVVVQKEPFIVTSLELSLVALTDYACGVGEGQAFQDIHSVCGVHATPGVRSTRDRGSTSHVRTILIPEAFNGGLRLNVCKLKAPTLHASSIPT